MRVAIIGAGVAGLTTAKALLQAGHDVVVFEKAPDVGGVWSRTRRYPGVTTQSPAAQYSFSDFPMPKGFPEWPTGEQVQQYLASYAEHFGLEDDLRPDLEPPGAQRLQDVAVDRPARERLAPRELVVDLRPVPGQRRALVPAPLLQPLPGLGGRHRASVPDDRVQVAGAS